MLKANMRSAKRSPSQQVGYAAAYLRAQLVRLPQDEAQTYANRAVEALIGIANEVVAGGGLDDDDDRQ